MNIPVAHTMGGEISGTIDESVRHAVTKLSHVHFPANQQAADRIIRMGEDPRRCTWWLPANRSGRGDRREGRGARIHRLAGARGRWRAHRLDEPVPARDAASTEHGREAQINETLAALQELRMPTIMLWPNADAGSEDTARGMRKFRERHRPDYIRFYKNFLIETWVRLMLASACVVGNSSAPIREGAYIGVPAVNIGTRQRGRDRGGNVVDVEHDRRAIVAAVRAQVAHGRYPSDHLYGDGRAGGRIASVLAEAPLTVRSG